jgi:succinate-acetate transporter protein
MSGPTDVSAYTAEARYIPDPVPAGPAVADPGPLGLAAFALTTFVLSCFNSGIVDRKGEAAVLGLALAYGGVAQLLAGMWEFRSGNTFGALAFTSFGAFWISFWWLISFGGAVTHGGVATFLLGWTIFTAYMTVAATRTSGAVLAVFVALTLTFLFLFLGEATAKASATGLDGLTKFGGWLGLLTAVLAWYASFAGVTNSTWKRTLLPTWPRA